MKNIKIINKNEVSCFLVNLWQSEEIKNLYQNHDFFRALESRLSNSPLFIYEMDDPNKESYHLTSFFRLIAKRSYENKIIQDLYYLHELSHAAQFEPRPGSSYSDFACRLSKNELFASLVSEVFVYLFDNNLSGKTFSPLWADRFISKSSKAELLPGSLPEAWFDVSGKSWCRDLKLVLASRNILRSARQGDFSSDPASAKIISYNSKHFTWVQRWKNHYQIIERMLHDLRAENISSEQFLDIINSNMDNRRRPFFPKAEVDQTSNIDITQNQLRTPAHSDYHL